MSDDGMRDHRPPDAPDGPAGDRGRDSDGQDDDGIRRGRLSAEERQQSFDEEDRRWTVRAQARDWVVLGLMVVASIVWMLALALFEPGLTAPLVT